MSRVIIRGACPVVSKSFIKAWIHGTIAILAFHGYYLEEEIVVRILPPSHKQWLPTAACPGGAVGYWVPWDRQVLLQSGRKPEHMATTIVHELIHALVGPFPHVMVDGELVKTEEKITSTLTARLKAPINDMAHSLMSGSQQRAAFMAHAKIAYRNKQAEDWYDPDQWTPIGIVDPKSKKPRLFPKGLLRGKK